MSESSWEAWLAERFPRYLLREARGSARSPEHVARALERLSGTPGAWVTLAELGFLLDPAGETEAFVLNGVPAFLRRILPTTVRRIEESQGRIRGRTDWSRTLQLRRRTRDPSWFVGVVPERTFETPGAIVIRFLLEQIVRAISDLRPGDLSGASGWLRSLSQMHLVATQCLQHAALREIPLRRPAESERLHCAQSHEPALRQAARVLGFYEELLPTPRGHALQRTVERFALAPTDEPRRFELFTLLAVLDALDGILPGWDRNDELVLPERKAVASWSKGASSVRVYYDQGTPPGTHADAIQHYLGDTASIRPDLRLVLTTAVDRRELYLDAKCSTDPSYLAQSHLKMLGYLADRPGVFLGPGPRVIITTPRAIKGSWRAGDPVAFLDPAGTIGQPLVEMLGTWLKTLDAGSLASA